MHKTTLNQASTVLIAALTVGALAGAAAAASTPFHFSTGDPDGRIATASRPEDLPNIEIESADDFILANPTSITHATFTGLLPRNAPLSSISEVIVEIYRVFPKDSDTMRAITVPTRTNSPSDNAFTVVDSSAGTLSFTATILSSSFTAANSVLNGITPMTGGEGSVTGEEVLFDIGFNPPLVLPADHYFFVPQVLLTSGNFFWLSAPKPIVAPGTPFSGDLQSWIRNANLDPDWLRIGTDIVDPAPPPTFNATFSLDGDAEVVAAPALHGVGLVLLAVLMIGAGALLAAQRARRKDNPRGPA